MLIGVDGRICSGGYCIVTASTQGSQNLQTKPDKKKNNFCQGVWCQQGHPRNEFCQILQELVSFRPEKYFSQGCQQGTKGIIAVEASARKKWFTIAQKHAAVGKGTETSSSSRWWLWVALVLFIYVSYLDCYYSLKMNLKFSYVNIFTLMPGHFSALSYFLFDPLPILLLQGMNGDTEHFRL